LVEVDEIFLTSAGIEIAKVSVLGKRTFEHSIELFQIKDFFNDFIKENQ
jgi:hypothetical protein